MKKKVIGAVMLSEMFMQMGGCGNLLNMSSYLYADAGKYTMGGATITDEIEVLDISWMAGEVSVNYHAEDTIVISETPNEELDENTTMYYLVDGDTLRIKFAKAGKWNFKNLKKELTVWLPEGLELEKLVVDSVSADVAVGEIAAKTAVLSAVSGDVELRDTGISQKAKIETTSGGVTLALSGNVEEILVETVSGEVDITLPGAKEIELDSTSGDLTAVLSGSVEEISAETVSGGVDITLTQAKKVKLGSTSGDFRLAMDAAPDSLRTDTVSGDLYLYLPEDADFTIEFDTVSGSLNSKRKMKKDGNDYIFGAGTKKYEVDSASGNVTVEEK